MKAAGIEEKQHAIEQNSYHHRVVPAITVIVDGGWSTAACVASKKQRKN